MVLGETKGGCGRVARSLAALSEHARSQDPAGIAQKHRLPKGGRCLFLLAA